MDRWLVVLSGRQLIDELQKLPGDVVDSATTDVGAFPPASREHLILHPSTQIFNLDYIFGTKLHEEHLHVPLLRTLTRHLSSFTEDMCDEAHAAFRELVPANTKGVYDPRNPELDTFLTVLQTGLPSMCRL